MLPPSLLLCGRRHAKTHSTFLESRWLHNERGAESCSLPQVHGHQCSNPGGGRRSLRSCPASIIARHAIKVDILQDIRIFVSHRLQVPVTHKGNMHLSKEDQMLEKLSLDLHRSMGISDCISFQMERLFMIDRCVINVP